MAISKQDFIRRMIPVIKGYHDSFAIVNMEDERALALANWIWEWSENYELDPILVSAIIATESNFRNVKGLTRDDGLGYMQIKVETAKAMAGDKESRDQIEHGALILRPEMNIQLGCKYLKYLLHVFGNWAKAISAYNADTEEKYLSKVVNNYLYIRKEVEYDKDK